MPDTGLLQWHSYFFAVIQIWLFCRLELKKKTSNLEMDAVAEVSYMVQSSKRMSWAVIPVSKA